MNGMNARCSTHYSSPSATPPAHSWIVHSASGMHGLSITLLCRHEWDNAHTRVSSGLSCEQRCCHGLACGSCVRASTQTPTQSLLQCAPDAVVASPFLHQQSCVHCVRHDMPAYAPQHVSVCQAAIVDYIGQASKMASVASRTNGFQDRSEHRTRAGICHHLVHDEDCDVELLTAVACDDQSSQAL